MCGILFTNSPSIPRQEFDKALGLMTHRGPDKSQCVAEFGENKLGHNRLKILDLDDRSNQPFTSLSGRYVMIFNGEIYNFKELEDQFGLNVHTTGDTEMLVELYASLGPQMLDHLNGMFSLVILDTQTHEIFAARDRLGIKPLYYVDRDGFYIFSSEISPILQLTGQTEFDEVGVRQYRKLRTFFNGRTLYSGISSFPPAHFILKGKLQRYWQLPEGEQPVPEDEEVDALIRSSIDYRCISDVPVGSYLSGGIDSTIVAGLASKPDTWTVGFESSNEFEWSRLAADAFGSHHTEVLIDEEEFVSLAREMVQKRCEPLSVPNEVLLYKMTQRVKEQNTVVLSGEGADELFFGYDRIFRWAEKGQWDIREFDRLYSYGSHDDLEILEDALEPFMRLEGALSRVAAFFQIAHLHGLLRRLDNATMICSVEARVPFVDHRLIERMAGVPFRYRMLDGEVKAPLKRIYSQIVPQEICRRKKVGFPVPLPQIPFPGEAGNLTPLDRWLEFNLDLVSGAMP